VNPAKDVEYPDPAGLADEPAEPAIDDDPETDIPAEYALDADDFEDVDIESDPDEPGGSYDGGDPLVEKGPLVEDVPDNESERLNGPRM